MADDLQALLAAEEAPPGGGLVMRVADGAATGG
jgi:hypothetical protein